MKVFGISNCDTVRAAIRALTAAGHAPELVDIRRDGLGLADLERFFEAFGAALVNRRSATWRGLSEAERAEPPVRQISAHPALMKRPVIEADGRLTLGWDEVVQAEWLGKPV
ncbi:MAG: arsenate reductase [Rhodobacterales bacterium CG2_30_65_12]|nr:MAG: arsenate reductase [Rhodobacterales bacterium CG2_30_65_12]